MHKYAKHNIGLLGVAFCFLWGCSSTSTFEEYRAFQAAGPVQPEIDWSKVNVAKVPSGQYRLGQGDLLRVTMPDVLSSLGMDQSRPLNNKGDYLCRVSFEGETIFPIVGKQDIEDFTLDQLEQKLISLYYPKYFNKPPAIVAQVLKHQLYPVRVYGAVNKPGVVELRRDELTIISAVAKAGGFVKEGAAGINLYRSDATQKEPIVLPISGHSIDFSDIAIGEQDELQVVRLQPRRISVIGLVKSPGVFDYAPEDVISLGEALGMAGGVDEIAAPPYATVYRQSPDGEIVSATFDIRKSVLSEHGQVLHPGDIVAVEPTAGAMARILITTMLNVSLNSASLVD